jgi:hypothetical protein
MSILLAPGPELQLEEVAAVYNGLDGAELNLVGRKACRVAMLLLGSKWLSALACSGWCAAVCFPGCV